MTLNPQMLAFTIALPLIAWRMYSRFKRLVGRQKSTSVRPWLPVILFPILITLISIGLLTHPLALINLYGGAVIGVGLGIYGLKLTKFEKTNEGLFYTPNAHLGIALSLLMLARIVYRMAQVFVMGAGSSAGPQSFSSSPLTMLILGTLAGYYVTYAIGHLRWRNWVNSNNLV
ncbi:MAG: hypothetical protein ABIP02_04505 [Arenimonas sp.]